MTAGFKASHPAAETIIDRRQLGPASRAVAARTRSEREAMKTRKSAASNVAHSTRLRAIERRLRAQYGQPHHHNPADPLDDLIFLVLSRMTQEVKYLRTYDALRKEMPRWDAVMEAPADDLESLLRDAGLAPTKTRQIQAILKEVAAREGSLDLTRLRSLSDSDVEAYLTRLPGVARKTARCVMLYALGRETCPVDTHVWRVMRRLGMAPDKAWSESNARRLEEGIPARLRSSLHVTLVAHGRSVCRARRPHCGECVLATLCPSAHQPRAGALETPAEASSCPSR